MKLSRRLFFGKAAGAIAAGPLAVEAIAKDVEGRAFSYGAPTGSFGGTVGTTHDELSWARSALKRLKKEAARPDSVHRLDADLVANRSLSLAARIRIQAERNVEREYTREKSSLTSIIDRITGA